MAAAGRMLQERVGNKFHVKKDQNKRSVGRLCVGTDFNFFSFPTSQLLHIFSKNKTL
jgi:hypothetical protein